MSSEQLPPRPHPLITMIAAYRRATGLRQADVAARMGTGQSSVSDLESGVVSPGVDTLERYAQAVGVRIVWGIAGIDATPIANEPSPFRWPGTQES